MSAQLYTFKISFKHRKRIWRRIEILSNQTLAEFDSLIRQSFNLDDYDHLSEFYRGKATGANACGVIYPDGKGEGSKLKVEQLNISIGDQIEYVYDFGSSVELLITLENISQPETKVEPRVIAQNKPKYYYCSGCEKQNKRTIAKWICIECSDNNQLECYLCDDCSEQHEEHYGVEELTY